MATKPSEYEGVGLTAAGVRNTTELTASEKLRLIYRTGEEDDANAPVDEASFKGAVTGEVNWT